MVWSSWGFEEDGEEDEDGMEEERMGAPKPMLDFETRLRISFWRPTKAPAKMKRMLSVRMLYVSALEGDWVEVLPEPEEDVGGMVLPESGLLVG